VDSRLKDSRHLMSRVLTETGRHRLIPVHCVPKKEVTKRLPITFSNLNRFSKSFHCWKDDEYFQQNSV